MGEGERLPWLPSDEVVRALRGDGWYDDGGTKHARLRHDSRACMVIIPRHGHNILKPKTSQSIIADAGYTVDEFRRLL